MAATPQYGTMTFTGLKSKTSYSVDVYLSDVANAMVRFDAGAGAGATSPDFYTFPEPVIMTDYAQVTGTADTTKIRLVGDGKPSAQVLRYTIHLTSLATRPKLNIGVSATHRFSAIQLA